MLAAVAHLFLLDPHDIAGPINAFIFGLTILLTGRWLQQHMESRFIPIWGTLHITFSLPLFHAASSAMSEMPFILLTILSLVQAEKFLSTGKSQFLIWSAAFTALACLTRYMGVTVAASVLLLLLFQRGIAWPNKVKQGVTYALIVSLPIGLWMLRNVLLVGEPTGPRPLANYSYLETLEDITLEDITSVLASWTLTMIVVLLGVMSLIVKTSKKGKRWTLRKPALTFGLFVLVYVVLLFGMLGGTGHGVQERYLLPIYIPLMFTCLFVADRLIHHKGEASKLLAVILVAVLSLQLGFSMIRTWYEIRQSNTGGIASFSTKKWVNSETIQYIRRNSANTLILSNKVYPIYIYTDGKGTYLYIRAKQDKLQQQLKNIKDSEGYLVFFHDWESHLFNYDASELRGLLGPAVAELSDGVIFKVNKSPVTNTNFYRSTYETQLQEDPIIRSVFDVYHKGRELTYVKEPCSRVEAKPRFFLHIIPADMNNLPDDRKQYGFDNFEFDFGRYGVRFDEKVCTVTISLPDYDIAYIRTGQFTSGKSGTIWKQEFRFDSNSSR